MNLNFVKKLLITTFNVVVNWFRTCLNQLQRESFSKPNRDKQLATVITLSSATLLERVLDFTYMCFRVSGRFDAYYFAMICWCFKGFHDGG
jgi:hypothetical protein